MQLNQETLLQSIRQNKLFPPESRLILAVSGGVDSLALLHCLAHLRPIYPLELLVATLNHGLRPEAAEEVAFVQSLSSSLNIPCITGQAQVGTVGIEAAARKARYDFLAEVAHNHNFTLVATAHQADDQSETILMHLIRGSGIQGLQGMSMDTPMPYHPELMLLRPLLPFSRTAIEAYCAEHGLEARQDASNFDTRYRRNAIRHEIVPRLRQINPQIDATLARLAEILSAEDAYMQQQFQSRILPHIEFAENVTFPRAAFAHWHIAMQRRAILAALAHLNISPNFEHIEAAIAIIKKGELGAIAEFGENIALRLDYEKIYLGQNSSLRPLSNYLQISTSLSLIFPSIITIDKYELIISKIPLPEFHARLAIPANAQLRLRQRRAGDIFKPLGMGGKSRKLKKWLIDHKIPQHLRDNLPLLEINGEIAAILLPESWAISESFAVNAESTNIFFFMVKNL